MAIDPIKYYTMYLLVPCHRPISNNVRLDKNTAFANVNERGEIEWVSLRKQLYPNAVCPRVVCFPRKLD